MTDAESAVLEAARKWLAAKEATLVADEMREDDRISTESAVDQAEYELTDAVYQLLGREPRLPPHRGEIATRRSSADDSNFDWGWLGLLGLIGLAGLMRRYR